MQPSRDYQTTQTRYADEAAAAAPAAPGPAAAGPKSAAASAAGSPVEAERLLHEVIEATLRGEGDSLSEAEWEAICGVARGRRDRPLDLPITVDLVAAFLSHRFAAAEDPRLLERMSLRISGSMWAHPAAQLRLRRFWDQLLEHTR